MDRTQTTRRVSIVRKVGWLSVASMLALALLAPGASPVTATGQSVTICHRTGSNSNPYVTESPSVQSNGATEGQLTGGHSNHLGPVWFAGITGGWGDIIPPYFYAPTSYSFPGLNWTAAGQAIYYSGCNPTTTTTTTTTTTVPTTTTTTSATTTTTTTVPTTTTTTQATTTQATTTQATTTQATTTQAATTQAQTVLAETGVPAVTTPPTDSFGDPAQPSSDSWRLILIVMAGLLAAVLVLTPATGTNRR